MTPMQLAAMVRAGCAADSIRHIGRQCTCPWRGPIYTTRPAHWARGRTDPACPVAVHQATARKAA